MKVIKKTRLLPKPAEITNVTSTYDTGAAGIIHQACNIIIEGNRLKLGPDDRVTFSGVRDGVDVNGQFTGAAARVNTETKLELICEETEGDALNFDRNTTVTFRVKGAVGTAMFV